MADEAHVAHEPRRDGPGRWVFWGFLAVAAYFLIMEHTAHVVQYLPFVLLAACPLMHLFHGHGSHGSHSNEDQNKPPTPREDKHGCH